VVSRAGWPDQIASDHRVDSLAEAALLHAGRPTVVTVGVGARPVANLRYRKLSLGASTGASVAQS
jgi:uroporphyrin-III C-methyltransferase